MSTGGNNTRTAASHMLIHSMGWEGRGFGIHASSILLIRYTLYWIDAFSFLSGVGLRWEPTAPRSRSSVCYVFDWNGISLSSPHYHPSRITTLQAISSSRLHATTSWHCRFTHP